MILYSTSLSESQFCSNTLRNGNSRNLLLDRTKNANRSCQKFAWPILVVQFFTARTESAL